MPHAVPSKPSHPSLHPLCLEYLSHPSALPNFTPPWVGLGQGTVWRPGVCQPHSPAEELHFPGSVLSGRSWRRGCVSPGTLCTQACTAGGWWRLCAEEQRHGNSGLSSQFCCRPKTTLKKKNRVYLKNRVESPGHQSQAFHSLAGVLLLETLVDGCSPKVTRPNLVTS